MELDGRTVSGQVDEYTFDQWDKAKKYVDDNGVSHTTFDEFTGIGQNEVDVFSAISAMSSNAIDAETLNEQFKSGKRWGNLIIGGK